ncbi:cellulose synthase operon protein YhjQ/BcsQ [Falsiroseomonas sp.]|jgi:cellulose synthase operon protein YhjQ|uniref:cellulose synthase operon protein YhjQ/BcsQ n=1 Tax=Falsiroseomonas sp. TaxID=2870721 RepID=UPI003F71C1FD
MPLIAFVSPKGGVGKTTLAASVAAVLAARGTEVIALDLDPQNALRLHLGVPIHEEAGFLAGLLDGMRWQDALRQTRAGVGLLPHGHTEPKASLDLTRLLLERPDLLGQQVREMLAAPGRVVIVDAAPGPSPALSAVLPLADVICVVLLADSGSASLIPSVASGRFLGRGTLASRAALKAMLVLNQVDLGAPLSDAVLEFAQQAMGDRPVSAVARDPAVAEALADRRLPVEGVGPGSEDIALLAETLAKRLDLGAPPVEKDRGRPSFSALASWGLRR